MKKLQVSQKAQELIIFAVELIAASLLIYVIGLFVPL